MSFDGSRVVLEHADSGLDLGWLDDDGRLDKEKLLAWVGEDEKVPVEGGQPMILSEIFQKWEHGQELYIKDWHACRERGKEERRTLGVPWDRDWLDPYCQARHLDDFRFVYLGPKGTGTGLHSDVRGTFSSSWSILGWKLWTFLECPRRGSSQFEGLIVASDGGERLLSLDGQQERWPDLTLTWKTLGRENSLVHHFVLRHPESSVLVILQPPNTKIYVPSLLYHLVQNLGHLDPDLGSPELVLSVNHNWINHLNVLTVFRSLLNDLEAVEKELDHLKTEMTAEEWLSTRETVLKSNSGWDLTDFWDFVRWTLQSKTAERVDTIVQCIDIFLAGRDTRAWPDVVEGYIKECLEMVQNYPTAQPLPTSTS